MLTNVLADHESFDQVVYLSRTTHEDTRKKENTSVTRCDVVYRTQNEGIEITNQEPILTKTFSVRFW